MIAQEAMRLKEAQEKKGADLKMYVFNLNLPAICVLVAETVVAAAPKTEKEALDQEEGWQILMKAAQCGDVDVLENWLKSVDFSGHAVTFVHNTRLVPTVGFQTTSQLIVPTGRSLIL